MLQNRNKSNGLRQSRLDLMERNIFERSLK